MEELTEKVEKRGNAWCVIHCHGKKAGTPIRCYKFGRGTDLSEPEAKKKAYGFHYFITKKKGESTTPDTSPITLEAISAIGMGAIPEDVVEDIMGT